MRCGVVVALLAALTTPAADGAEAQPAISTPQKVSLVFQNTRLTGTLVELSKSDLVFQLTLGGPKVKYPLDDIREIRAFKDNDVFYFDPRTHTWDTLSARKKAAADALRGRNIYKDIPDPPPVRERFYAVGEGTAATEEKAVLAAEQAAVQQAILDFPDGITLLHKRKEIEDLVLPGCEELVKARSPVLSHQTGENSATVRIAVALDRKAIAERLTRAGIKISDNARGVAASLPSQDEIRRRPEPVLRAVLSDFHRTLLVGGAPGDFDGRSLKVYCRVSADHVAYDLAVENLIHVLDAIKRKDGKSEAEQALSPVEGSDVPRYRSPAIAPRPARLKFRDPEEWDIWVMTRRDEAWSHVTWEQWAVNADVERSLADVAGRLGVEVCVLGAGGTVLATAVVPQEPAPRRPEVFWKWGPAHYKTTTPNRHHLFLSPVGIQLQALLNQGVLDCKLVEEFSRDVYVGPLPAGQKITGVQARLVLMKEPPAKSGA
jgi:hypothetical protein